LQFEKQEVSMSNKRYTTEFKTEVTKQVTESGYSVKEVAERLGVSTSPWIHSSLYFVSWADE
jgi:transposase-like protein